MSVINSYFLQSLPDQQSVVCQLLAIAVGWHKIRRVLNVDPIKSKRIPQLPRYHPTSKLKPTESSCASQLIIICLPFFNRVVTFSSLICVIFFIVGDFKNFSKTFLFLHILSQYDIALPPIYVRQKSKITTIIGSLYSISPIVSSLGYSQEQALLWDMSFIIRLYDMAKAKGSWRQIYLRSLVS